MIFSDSLIVVGGFHVHCNNSSIRRLIHRIHDLQITGKTICLCWIPSHIGIEGNELADAAARAALINQRNQSLLAMLTGEALSDVHWRGNGNTNGNCAGRD